MATSNAFACSYDQHLHKSCAGDAKIGAVAYKAQVMYGIVTGKVVETHGQPSHVV